MFEKLKNISDPFSRLCTFLAAIGEICRKNDVRPPIVVGDSALEFYTKGEYLSGNVDLKGNLAFLEKMLLDAGFIKTEKRLRFWSEEFQFLVNWQGACLKEDSEAEKRVMIFETLDGPICVISPTNLIADRLNAAKWGRDATSEEWAEVLLRLGRQNVIPVNWSALDKATELKDCKDLLEKIMKKMETSDANSVTPGI